MKALSVKQPWAFLIGGGEKTIELRSWATDYRGQILICASQSERDAWVIVDGKQHQLPPGVMMCVADLVDVRRLDDTEENRVDAYIDEIPPDTYGWFLENIRHVRLKPVSGRLRLFDVPDDEIEYVDDKYDFFAEAEKFATGRTMSERSLWVSYD